MRTKTNRAYKTILLFFCVLTMLLSGCDTGRSLRASRECGREIMAGSKLLAKGEKKSALRAFDRALAVAQGDLEIHMMVISLLMKKEMYEESIPYIQHAINLPPEGKTDADLMMDKLWDSELHTALGDAYSHLKRVAEAEGSYQEAILLNKDNAAAYNNWGYMYADQGVRLDEAVRLAKRAVDLKPNNGYFVDSVGWAYLRKGEARKAMGLLRRAAELCSSDAEIRYHLGRAYEAIGDGQAALVEYRKVLRLSPSHESTLKRIDALRARRHSKCRPFCYNS